MSTHWYRTCFFDYYPQSVRVCLSYKSNDLYSPLGCPILCVKASTVPDHQLLKHLNAETLGGDFLKGDGTGSFSIYGDKFPVSRSSDATPIGCLPKNLYQGRKLSREAFRTRPLINGKSRHSVCAVKIHDRRRLTQGRTQTDVKYMSLLCWHAESYTSSLVLHYYREVWFFGWKARCLWKGHWWDVDSEEDRERGDGT